jgi:hypothetical protein
MSPLVWDGHLPIVLSPIPIVGNKYVRICGWHSCVVWLNPDIYLKQLDILFCWLNQFFFVPLIFVSY